MASANQIKPASFKPELHSNEITEMSQWFMFFDKNKDNKLDYEELRKVFHAMCWDFTDEEFTDIFKSADKDENGYIDYNEYLGLLQKFQKDPIIERLELIEAFRRFDKDQNGYINTQTLRKYMQSRDLFLSKETESLMSEADKNGNGMLNIEEFVDMILMKPTANLVTTKN